MKRKPIERQSEPPSSIEHQLDMEAADQNVTGERVIRGDFRPPLTRLTDRDPRDATEIIDEMSGDMAEGDREGFEQSGDDHSAGLQGAEAGDAEPSVESDIERRRIDRA